MTDDRLALADGCWYRDFFGSLEAEVAGLASASVIDVEEVLGTVFIVAVDAVDGVEAVFAGDSGVVPRLVALWRRLCIFLFAVNMPDACLSGYR